MRLPEKDSVENAAEPQEGRGTRSMRPLFSRTSASNDAGGSFCGVASVGREAAAAPATAEPDMHSRHV